MLCIDVIKNNEPKQVESDLENILSMDQMLHPHHDVIKGTRIEYQRTCMTKWDVLSVVFAL